MQTLNHKDHTDSSSRFFSDSLILILFAAVITYITYSLVITLAGQDLSDYNGHIYIYLTTFTGENALKGYMMSPYFLWHIIVLFFNKMLFLPLDVSAAVCTVIFTLASFFLTVFMTGKFCRYKGISASMPLISFTSFILTMAQPIWSRLFDAGISRNVGAFSPNPIYNPTQVAARPFALLCFMLITDWWRLSERDDSSVFFGSKKKQTGILLSVMLFISAFAKPVFAMMFIPSVGLVMIARLIGRAVKKNDAPAYFKNNILMALLIALPCIAFILFQTLLFFALGGSYTSNDGIVITGWLEVWGAFTENVPLSLFFSMSFPLFILVTDFRNYIKEDFGSLGITCFAVGFLECALIGEGGNKLYHGNFMWQMMFGMLILWICTLLHFFEIGRRPTTKLSRIIIVIGWILLLIHLHQGFMYISEVLGWGITGI